MKKLAFVGIIALAVLFMSFISTQLRSYYALAGEEAHLQAELEQEHETTMRYNREKEQYMSDAHVERIAREKLGLVRPDEKVFINDAAK